jgi:hypothetical protein
MKGESTEFPKFNIFTQVNFTGLLDFFDYSPNQTAQGFVLVTFSLESVPKRYGSLTSTPILPPTQTKNTSSCNHASFDGLQEPDRFLFEFDVKLIKIP